MHGALAWGWLVICSIGIAAGTVASVYATICTRRQERRSREWHAEFMRRLGAAGAPPPPLALVKPPPERGRE